MRKVFLSIMILQEIKPTEYISDDFVLPDAKYDLPMSYIIDSNLEENEEFTVITCVEKSETGQGASEKNYEIFKKEIDSIAFKHNSKVCYQEISLSAKFKSSTFNHFFKDVAKRLKEDDEVYMDMTFGMKPYSISMFIAAAYAINACGNSNIACAFYSQKFAGSKDAKTVSTSKLYDLTALLYLNKFASKVEAGDKAFADSMLDTMIPDKDEEV